MENGSRMGVIVRVASSSRLAGGMLESKFQGLTWPRSPKRLRESALMKSTTSRVAGLQ